MSTRCLIAYQHANGEIESVYCHSDGYVSGVGKMLVKDYQDDDKILNLIQRGDFSSLCPEIGEIKFYKPIYQSDNYSHNNEYCFIDYADPSEHEYLYKFEASNSKWFGRGRWEVSQAKTVEVEDGYKELAYYYSEFKPVSELITEVA